MEERLLKLLKQEYRVQQWKQTPIKEWHGFTVEDMEDFRFYHQVQDWFNKLTDEEVLAISRKKYLSLSSSPVYK